jgi:hypothetical protein
MRRRKDSGWGLLRRSSPQPLLGSLFALSAVAALAAAWLSSPYSLSATFNLTHGALALSLSCACVVSTLYPVHVARAFKLSTLTIPLFLLTILTPPALAATCTAVVMLVGELGQRTAKGSVPGDIATCVGRLTLAVLAASIVGHLSFQIPPPLDLGRGLLLPLGAPLAQLPVLLAAPVLYVLDALGGSLEIAAITGDHPGRSLQGILTSGAAAEGVLYLAGIIGALAALPNAWTVVLLVAPGLLVRRLLKQGMEMHDETRALLESMADAVDLRDPYTGGHSRRVTVYAAAILRAMDLRGPEVDLITAAARVHDIGKIAIPDRILNKPDRLTDEERAEMESHPRRGADFLARYPDFRRGVGIVLHHHERIDGKGYPHGLAGDAIPFGARVIAVADTFDAVTSDRPYRRGMSIQQAAQILQDGRGTQWDSHIVDVFTSTVIPQLVANGTLSPAPRDCPAA